MDVFLSVNKNRNFSPHLVLSVEFKNIKMSYRLKTILSLLLTLLLSTPTSCSTSIPRNSTTPSSLFLSLPVANPQASKPEVEHKCAKAKFLRTDHRPTWAECYRAIRLLPSIHDSGTFHTSGLNDVWRLPRVESFLRCRAQVELAPQARVPFSWIAVKAALDQLSRECRDLRATDERTGGWMITGPDWEFKVSLLGPKDPDIPHLLGKGASNETSTE